MSWFRPCIAIVTFFALAAAQVTPGPSAPAHAEQEVRALEQYWLQAEDDPAALESVLADDFLHVLPAGIITKSEQLDYMRRRPHSAPADRHFADLKVRVYGTAAVATGMVASTREGKPQKSLFTDVFAYRNGRWQAVSAQELEVPIADHQGRSH